MSEVSRLLADPVMLRVGLALAHFVWQGTALAAVAALALVALRKAKPAPRYLVLLAVLLAMVACPVVTFLRAVPPQPDDTTRAAILKFAARARAAQEQAAPSATPAPHKLVTSLAPPRPLSQRVAAPAVRSWEWLRPRLSWAVVAWALGVFLLSIRLFVRWRALGAATREGRPLAEERSVQMLARLCETVQVARAVQLLQSSLARVPTTLGWLRPVVLLPASALTGLTPRQLEAVVAHELAHIRRHDYLVNLVQTVLETLLFYHPAVWWVSGRIRLEREQCCDEIAITACGNPRTYAGALMQLAHVQSMPLAVAATGSLSARLHRLAGTRTRSHALASWVAALVPALAVVAVVLGPKLPAAAGHKAERPPATRARPLPLGEFPVCVRKSQQWRPRISGDIVVWTDYRSNPGCRDLDVWPDEPGGDIYGYDLRRQREFAICTARGVQRSPAVDGNIVVWTDFRNDSDGRFTRDGSDNGDIYGYNLVTGKEFPICTAEGHQDGPAVSGNLVVWDDSRYAASNGGDIWGRYLGVGDAFPICVARGDQYAPVVSGTVVVWWDFRNDPNQRWDADESLNNCDIYARDLAQGSEFPVCTNPFNQQWPSISGGTVVWSDFRSCAPSGPDSQNTDVYGYDLRQKREFTITTALGTQHLPSISGDRVVFWEAPPNAPGVIVLHDLRTGEETRLLSGGHAAWPAISGDVVVWCGTRDGKGTGYDIYAYRLPPPDEGHASALPPPPQRGPMMPH